ncbi:MAG TPA: hypothetical protein VEL47_02115 [Myxococcota bacterium]|nr:hypothetical protein [Myxococcota bacterium]
MKIILFGCLLVTIISGCGDIGSINLGEGPDWLTNDAGTNGTSYTGGYSCKSNFVTPLIEEKVSGYAPTIRFVASQRGSVIDSFSNRSSVKERCDEIQNRLSGFSIKDGSRIIRNILRLDIKFELPWDATDEMLLGRTISARPTQAHLEFTDGSLKDSMTSMELRCPGAAAISCRITEIGDYKRCDSYVVDYSDHCTFRNSVVTYSFSDHQKTQLDIAGELHISGSGEAQLKFTKLAWSEVF